MEEGTGQRGPRGLHALVGVVLAFLVTFAPWPDPTVGRMAGVAVWMAYWWVMEAVPIPVTSLLPLVLLPAMGILDFKTVSSSYGKPTIFLFLGGFLLALGLQRSGLHRRLALHIVRAVGSEPSRLILGFMLASAFLSMWLSNTASVMVMLPIALSVVKEAEGTGVAKAVAAKLGTALMLGIAYAADIGGMATPVGTPPNMVLIELQSELLPELPPIAFGQWMQLGLPLSAVFLTSGWLLLTKVLFATGRIDLFGGAQAIDDALAGLGQVRRDELAAGGVFAATALLWMTGADLRLTQSLTLPGWREMTGLLEVGDGAVAVAAATLLFLLPSADRPGEALMDWASAKEVPWGILLLFGGGFALAAGFQHSGLSAVVGASLGGLAGLPEPVLVAVVSLVMTFLTELTSNTATTTLVLPILADAAATLQVDPRVLMVPATLSASCAFMMPVASPTQAIVFGSGYVTIRQMVRAGIGFNLLGVLWVTVFCVLLGPWVFGG